MENTAYFRMKAMCQLLIGLKFVLERIYMLSEDNSEEDMNGGSEFAMSKLKSVTDAFNWMIKENITIMCQSLDDFDDDVEEKMRGLDNMARWFFTTSAPVRPEMKELAQNIIDIIINFELDYIHARENDEESDRTYERLLTELENTTDKEIQDSLLSELRYEIESRDEAKMVAWQFIYGPTR